MVRAEEAETVRDKPLQPKYVRAAPTALQTWPWVWREEGNSAGEGRPRGLQESSDGSSEGRDGAQGRDRGRQFCQLGRQGLRHRTWVRSCGGTGAAGSGTKVRVRRIKSEPLAALSS